MQLNLELHKDVDLQMKQLASFWTKDINHKRGGQPLSATTAGKTKERLLSELPVDALYMYSNGYCTCKIHIYWSQTLTCSIPGVLEKHTQYDPRLEFLNNLQIVDIFLNFLKVFYPPHVHQQSYFHIMHT